MNPPCPWTDHEFDGATDLARQARRAGLVAALRSRPDLTLAQLIRLVDTSKYADELRMLRVEDLLEPVAPPPAASGVAVLERAVMRVFRAFPGRWFSSGFFVRYLELDRWMAQKICVVAAEDGRLERRGRTSATRYRLARARLPASRAAVQ